MKKIVHLTSVHRRHDQRILWRECVSLREHGYDVTLVVNDNLKNEILDNGIKILSTGFLPQGRIQRMTEGVNRVYELGRKIDADLYHIHDPELLRIALKLKRRGKHVIFDSHEFYGEQIRTRQYIYPLLRKIISKSYSEFETYVCRRIDGVVLPATCDGKDLFLDRAQRTAIVANYPRLSEYEKISVPHYNIRKNVCYCGNLTEEHSIERLVAACKQVETKAILAGIFHSQDYKEKVLASGHKDSVQYLGYIDNRLKIYELYSQCAIGVDLSLDLGQYSKVDTMPTKIYEYMAAAMPVIISDFPYHRKLIDKYHFGIVANPSDVNDIASKIDWLHEHPQESKEMGENGKQLLENQFGWNIAEKELLRLYGEIL